MITVLNFPALGQLVAMRFIEWVQDNPGGVISLPTGKTPEHFIKWVNRLVQTWDDPATRELLEKNGVDPARRPDMHSLHFVQIDEFYPIQPTQKNSFYHYVKKFYIDGMGLDPHKALLMNCQEIGISPEQDLEAIWPDSTVDLTLRTRQASTDLERMQQDVLSRIDDWCQRREEQIRALGRTRVLSRRHRARRPHRVQHPRLRSLLDHPADGHQLRDAGGRGRRSGRDRSVAPATGDHDRAGHDHLQSRLARRSSSRPARRRPAWSPTRCRVRSAFGFRPVRCASCPNARFYITLGAAKQLRRRQVSLLVRSKDYSDEQVMRAVVDLSLQRNKPLLDLTEQEAQQDLMLSEVLKGRQESFHDLVRLVRDRLIQTIERGSSACANTRFLHTEPHHDDLMLGYLPHIVRNMRNPSNDHHFVTLTSGFTAVTNQFMLRTAEGTRTLDPLARVPDPVPRRLLRLGQRAGAQPRHLAVPGRHRRAQRRDAGRRSGPAPAAKPDGGLRRERPRRRSPTA